MAEDEKKGPSKVSVISAVFEDGSVVETIFHRDRAKTSFVVGRGEKWTFETSIQMASGEMLVPVRADNNLLKHGVLLLPDRPSDYGDEETLVREIAQYIRRYVDLSPTFESIAVHFVLLTWVYDAFNELPYLRFRGDYGSGKTRALLTVGSLCYKAVFASGASTVSPIFHILDSFGGTLILDEADFRFSDEKSDLVKILNNGNAKGLPVLRTMVSPNGKEFNPRAFNVFGPKMLASRGSFEDRALESRFITEQMGARNMRSDIPINLPETQRAEAAALRNKLLVYRLRNRHLMFIDETLVSPTLEPRFNQILLPLLSVVSDQGLQVEIKDYVQQAQEEHVSERGQSVEGRVVEVLATFLAESPNQTAAVSDLVSRFVAQFGSEFVRPMTPKWMGFVLRRKLGLMTFRHSGTFYVSLAERDKLSLIFRRYGLEEHANDVPGQ